MEKILELLIELQEIDLKLQQLEKSKGNLPGELIELKNQQAQIIENSNSKEQALQILSQNRRRQEMEIKTLEDQLKKYREQIYSVKTNKEYDAITAEIETTEIEISDYETGLLEGMEAEGKLKPEIELLKQSQTEIQSKLIQKEAELKQLVQLTEKELADLAEHRKSLVVQVDKPVLAIYERVRKAKGGIAVVAIENGKCSGCGSNLPPKTTMEIKRMNQTITCLYCGRFIIYHNNVESTTNHSE